MSEHGLTPQELKQQNVSEIDKISSFKTLGMSEPEAKAFLKTPEGDLFYQRLVEADPNAPTSEIDKRGADERGTRLSQWS